MVYFVCLFCLKKQKKTKKNKDLQGQQSFDEAEKRFSRGHEGKGLLASYGRPSRRETMAESLGQTVE